MTAPPAPFGEIESPRPLSAPDGLVELHGWCLAPDGSAPEVRLFTTAGAVPLHARRARDDVAAAFTAVGAVRDCGFTLRGPHPPGVFTAQLQARTTGGWHTFRHASLAVTPVPFTAVIEGPVATGTLTVSRRVSGWAFDPQEPVADLTLRYGHRDVACDAGRPRTDVPALFPTATHTTPAGFESALNLPAGRGPLRVRARRADGRPVVARTALAIAIDRDENGGTAPTNATLVMLPGYARRAPEPAAPAKHPRNLLFLLYGNFTSNSALQACAFANELAAAGHDCAVAVPADAGTVRHHLAPRFRALTHADALARAGGFANGRGPNIIHAWTTREHVRRSALEIHARHGGRLVVHLEDNEHEILAQRLGRPAAELEALPDAELDPLVPADLSHPRRGPAFLAAADGVTVITERLAEFAPPGRPCLVLRPAADARFFFPRPVPAEFRRVLDPVPGTTVIFYPGNVHASNAAEVRELYAAVARLNESGLPVLLLRAGVDTVDFLGPWAARVQPHVLELGQILRHWHMAELLALADLFVQPGAPDAFNDYRLPSKLPEFFALGRPVILPRTNLGEKVRHGVDAWVLERADAAGIAAAVREIRGDPALAARLSEGAVRFAAGHFSWSRSAQALASFYAALAAS